MKIAELETFVVGNPPPGYGGRYFIFVKLVTDNGITGIGEVYNATFGPRTVVKMVEDVFERHFLGRDPFRLEAAWREVYGRGFTLRPDVSVMGIMSALDIACYDIMGKAADRPAYDFLGGRVHERLRTYTYLYPRPGEGTEVYSNPVLAAERAVEYVDQGFTAVKFDPAGDYTVYDPHQPTMEDLDRSEQFVKLIREAVGNRADMLFGTHGQFTPSGAARLARRIEPYDPLWFEEPVPPDMPEEMAKVARSTTIPIATGERLTTKYEFARVLDLGAANILQMNLGRVGGFLEAKKIAALAETHHAQIAPHCYCGPIVGAANAQLAAASPNFLILECIQTWDGFMADLLDKPLQWEDGYLVMSGQPGLGVTLNEDVARAHPYDGDRLHLEMIEDPGASVLFPNG